MNKGFLAVASVNKYFLTATQLLADSIKEYSSYPITLITDDKWVDDPGNHIFDNVIGGAPDNIRAKLWGLSKTPYDITCYLDADMVCLNSEADNVFDALMDNDIVFTKIRPYAAANVWWKIDTEYRPHGGSFVWKNNNKMQSFMEQWWENWLWKSKYNWHERWTKSNEIYGTRYNRDRVRGWDQFPLHLMLLDENDSWYRGDVKWNWYFNSDNTLDAKWNFCHAYEFNFEGFDRNDAVFYSYKKDQKSIRSWKQ